MDPQEIFTFGDFFEIAISYRFTLTRLTFKYLMGNACFDSGSFRICFREFTFKANGNELVGVPIERTCLLEIAKIGQV